MGSANTVARIADILESVAAADNGVGVRPLARELGLDRSTVGRLLSQLRACGLVDFGPGEAGYVAGPRLQALGLTITNGRGLAGMVRPIIQALVDRFDETCYLAILEGHQVAYRLVVECHRPVRYVVPIGVASPLHAGAAGRAILTGMSPEEVERVLGPGRLRQLAENTITNRALLRKVLAKERLTGFSVSVGERVASGAAVGAPFFDATGKCRGSIVMAFPRERIDEHDIDLLGQAVLEASQTVSRLLQFESTEARVDPHTETFGRGGPIPRRGA